VNREIGFPPSAEWEKLPRPDENQFPQLRREGRAENVKSETIKLAAELENEFLEKSGTGFQVSIFLCGGAGKQEGELRSAIGTRNRPKI
jgi:hypothetical protein